MHPDPDPERRLAGLHAYAQARRQATVERLRAGIDALRAQGQPITARTIWQQTGLAYNSYARNAEAYALYRQTSSHLTAQRRRRAKPTLPSGKRDPWLSYRKTTTCDSSAPLKRSCAKSSTASASCCSRHRWRRTRRRPRAPSEPAG
jgi:hypothetical protein